jgi:hypothetical protein
MDNELRPVNTSEEVITGGRRRRSRSSRHSKRGSRSRSSRHSKRGGRSRSSRHSKHGSRSRSSRHRSRSRKQRGGLSMPTFITDLTRGLQYGAEKALSDVSTRPLLPSANPNAAYQPALKEGLRKTF